MGYPSVAVGYASFLFVIGSLCLLLLISLILERMLAHALFACVCSSRVWSDKVIGTCKLLLDFTTCMPCEDGDIAFSAFLKETANVHSFSPRTFISRKNESQI